MASHHNNGMTSLSQPWCWINSLFINYINYWHIIDLHYKEVKQATGKRLKWLLESLVFLCESESVLKYDFGKSDISHPYEKYFKS